MGLIKVDLLGLGMMAVLKDCADLIPRHYGRQIDIAPIPHDDSKVYESLYRPTQSGCSRWSRGHRWPRCREIILTSSKISSFRWPSVQVRSSAMMNPHMERRGRQEIRYPHPLLKSVLHRTLGVPPFQEQLLRIAMTIRELYGRGSRRTAPCSRKSAISGQDESTGTEAASWNGCTRRRARSTGGDRPVDQLLCGSTGVAVGRHPMGHCRDRLLGMKVTPARDLGRLRHRVKTRVAGCCHRTAAAWHRPRVHLFYRSKTRPGSQMRSSTPNLASDVRQVPADRRCSPEHRQSHSYPCKAYRATGCACGVPDLLCRWMS